MSKVRDVAGEARFYIAGLKAIGMPIDVINSLNSFVAQLEHAGTHLAPIEVDATFTRLAYVGDHIAASTGDDVVTVKRVTLYITTYETQSDGVWISVHMQGGPTGYESFVFTSALARRPVFPNGWLACAGTPGSWDRCMVSADEMHRALTHWGFTG